MALVGSSLVGRMVIEFGKHSNVLQIVYSACPALPCPALHSGMHHQNAHSEPLDSVSALCPNEALVSREPLALHLG